MELKTHPDHYQFRPLGHLIMATNNAHHSIPISILPLKIKLKAARELSKTLLKMAKQIGNRTPAGLYLRALSSVSNTKYEIVHSKFESVDFFCGQKSNVDMTELFDSINQRRKEPNHMLPHSYHPSNALPETDCSMNKCSILENQLIHQMIQYLMRLITTLLWIQLQQPQQLQQPSQSLILTCP